MYYIYIYVFSIYINMSLKCNCQENSCRPHGKTPRFLEPCVLLILARGMSYGYEIIEMLKKGILVETNPDAGAVYRILRCLEKNQYIISAWNTAKAGAAKRMYTITDSGRGYLARWAENIKTKRDCLNSILKEYSELKKSSGQKKKTTRESSCP
ncbi:MAG TPA: hypothetical protein DC049_09935, partial [Spirochaetia bacterium]|nr:hypothetical protein [Spirochaetia bacterium]